MGFAQRREDGGYEVAFEEIPTADLHDDEQGMRELTRRHVRCLEAMVRKHPESWLWQHKRWKHQPSGDSTLIDDPEHP
jgi:KDO2-lipid IV(A) lauroyltransferase